MNALRRKQIQTLVSELETIANALSELADEEQVAFDALPEGLQQSEQGQLSESAADVIRTASEEVETAAGELSTL
jgi:hypothetical protein